jgi:hypothetical protein
LASTLCAVSPNATKARSRIDFFIKIYAFSYLLVVVTELVEEGAGDGDGGGGPAAKTFPTASRVTIKSNPKKNFVFVIMDTQPSISAFWSVLSVKNPLS